MRNIRALAGVAMMLVGCASTSADSSSPVAGGAAGTVAQTRQTLPGPTECRSEADCTGGFRRCLAPGEFAGCGTCFVIPPFARCSVDDDCAPKGDSYICTRPQCSCGGMTCTPGCTSDTQCAASEVCGDDHRCTPADCAVDDDCPSNFACTGAAGATHCTRKACADDAECDGACVKKACYDGPGHCAGWPA